MEVQAISNIVADLWESQGSKLSMDDIGVITPTFKQSWVRFIVHVIIFY